MKIYLDNSVYNRPFDNQTQPRIWIETLSLSLILQLIGSKEVELVSSSIVAYENVQNPFPDRREWTDSCLKLAKYNQTLNEDIRKRARGLENHGLDPMDALHVACAEAAQVDYFVTCDDRISKRYKTGKMRVLNPVQFVLIITT